MSYLYETVGLDDRNLCINREILKFESYMNFSRSLKKCMEEGEKLIIRVAEV